ncbi:MAG: hypothetical protein HYU71_03735 [Bacteroidetes bacterium]|nr:hypothetical protein [Bacteroidota bacterium]
MHKSLLLVLLLVAGVQTGHAQSAEDSVKTTIGNLFSAMRNADGKAVMFCFADSAIMQTIARNKEGEAVIRNEKPANFATAMGSMPKMAADERISFEVVKVDGALAIAWTPYLFYYNGKFSHCGVNSFQLVRQNGTWKIQYLIDTRRKQGCKE